MNERLMKGGFVGGPARRRFAKATKVRTGLRRSHAVVVAVAVSVGLAGCGSGSRVDQGAGRTGSDSIVTLVTYQSFALDDDVRADFERRSGLKLRILAAGDSGQMITRAVARSGRPEGDVIFGVDDASLSRLNGTGVLARANPTNLKGVAPTYRSMADGRVVPVDVGEVCVNADTSWFAQRGLAAPETLDDLTEPAYRNLLVVPDPAASSPGLSFLLATIAASPDTWTTYWTALRSNGVSVAGSWDDAYYQSFTLSGGDRPLVVSYSSSPPAELIYAEPKPGTPPPDTPRSRVLLDTCFRQVEFAGILAGAPNPTGAKALVDFMLGDRWQGALAESNFVFPVREGVTLPEVFRTWAPRPEHPFTMDPATIGSKRSGWIEEWRRLMA